ncbi:MAG: sulfur carrier protein ThiS [Bacteroidales bacterium]|nr:sulfur carrier protein ThiS [Bacteroidales bacterium]
MAKITVNGESKEVRDGITLKALIEESGVLQPDMVSVQLNEQFAEREEWDRTVIKEGDSIDFLYFMGGGAA